MKLKKFFSKDFFNPTIFRKNILLNWPIWGLYLCGLLLLLPGIMTLSFLSSERSYPNPLAQELNVLASVTQPEIIIYLNALFALICAISVFSYLNTSKNVTMVHSLPLSRWELMVTNVLSGLAMLILPEIVAFVLAVIVCLLFHVTATMILFMWLLYSIAISLISFGFSLFCVFLAGHPLGACFYYILLNSLYYIIRYLISLFMGFLGYGISNVTVINENAKLSFLSPLIYLSHKVGSGRTYGTVDGRNKITSIYLYGGNYIAAILVVVFVIYFLCWLMYKHRKIELAGEMVAIPFVRPVIRWIIGFVVGFIGAYLAYEFLLMAEIHSGLHGMLLFLLFFGVFGYTVAQMIISKSFRVFHKRYFSEGILFLLVLTSVYFASAVSAHFLERDIPNVNEIKVATIDYNYRIEFAGDDIEFVRKLQETIVDWKDDLYRPNGLDSSMYNGNTFMVSISYELNNGETISRHYEMRDCTESRELLKMINKKEMEPDNFARNVLGYKDAERTNLAAVAVFTPGEFGEYDEITSEIYSFPQALYQAAIADAKNGKLQKYNIAVVNSNGEYVPTYQHLLSFRFALEETEVGISSNGYDIIYDDQGEAFEYRDIRFGPDCTNIINCLIQYDMIFSSKDLILE